MPSTRTGHIVDASTAEFLEEEVASEIVCSARRRRALRRLLARGETDRDRTGETDAAERSDSPPTLSERIARIQLYGARCGISRSISSTRSLSHTSSSPPASGPSFSC